MAKAAITMPSMIWWGFSEQRCRSLKVPGSLSSLLQIRYFGPGMSFGTNDHLRPVGKPAPPRPRSPDCFISSIRASRVMAPPSTLRTAV